MVLKLLLPVVVILACIVGGVVYLYHHPTTTSITNLDTTVTLGKIAENPSTYIGKKVEILGFLQKTWSFPKKFKLPDEFKYQYVISPICSDKEKTKNFVIFAYSKEDYGNFSRFFSEPEIIVGKIVPFQEINEKLSKYTEKRVLMLEIESVKTIPKPEKREIVIPASSIGKIVAAPTYPIDYLRISPSGNIIATSIMMTNNTKSKMSWDYDAFILQIYLNENKYKLATLPFHFYPYYIDYIDDTGKMALVSGSLDYGYTIKIFDLDGSNITHIKSQDILKTLGAEEDACIRIYFFKDDKIWFKLGKILYSRCKVPKNSSYYSFHIFRKEVKKETKSPVIFQKVHYSRKFKECEELYEYDIGETGQPIKRFDSSDGKYTIFVIIAKKNERTEWGKALNYIKIVIYDNSELIKYLD